MLSMDEAGRAFGLAYERAGIGPEDLNLVQVHDSIAPEEMLSYQMLGLCKPGEEGPLLRSGATRIGGRIPVNTDGGLLARGHPIAASGVAQIVESVNQLRGEAGARQVWTNNLAPSVAAVQNAGAQGGPSGGTAVSAAFILTA
jgi:acetyl-CoA acetyltransferase